MRRLSDRFAEAADACGDLSQLGSLLGDVALQLGFHHFALLDHASLASSSNGHFRIDNYPDDWVEELVGCAYGVDDPVHLASRRTNAGFKWCELGNLIRLDRRHRMILSRSRHHGLGGGFTVPANVPGEPSASCSFAVRAGFEVPLTRLRCAELVGAHALRAARRIHGRPTSPPRPHLSRRELECLRLVALGKTNWEIARILGISVETVRQYLKRARAAYDVVSRTQLVVYGLRDQWLTFDESVPFGRD